MVPTGWRMLIRRFAVDQVDLSDGLTARRGRGEEEGSMEV